jgi:RHS repeat-associated protein
MVKSGTSTTSYEYDANNRLRYEYSQDGTTEYIYDNNGNQKTKVASNDSSTYTYDGFNQLIKVEEGKGSYSYTYNGDGLRTSKAINGEKIVHVWDGQQVVAEINGSGNVTDKYIRGINLIYFDNSSTKSYYLFNGHGDVVHLTDGSGAVTKNYDYDAFGNLLTGESEAVILWGDVDGNGSVNALDFAYMRLYLLGFKNSFPAENGLKVADVNGNGSFEAIDFGYMRQYLLGMIKKFPAENNLKDEDDNPFRYCGEYWDKETGTIYLRARYYNPVIGRFITEDSYWGEASDPLSLNLYTYCHNDPINLFDPSGHEYTTLRELVNTSINGSIIPNNKEGYVTVSAYGKTVNVDYDTSKNSYQMSNVNGTLYMDRTEFLKMMGVDAIVMSSGNYNVSKIEAKLRTGAANAPAFMAGSYVTGYSLTGKKSS